MKISEFDFDLPSELIAQYPAIPRDSSCLLKMDKAGNINEHIFRDIADFFDEGDVLVFNDSKVIAGYLKGEIEGKKVSFNLIDFDPQSKNDELVILGKPKKLFKESSEILVSDELKFRIKGYNEDGTIIIEYQGGKEKLIEDIEKHGSMPLPPYILKKRGVSEKDKQDYQTIYAKNPGSVAAPTAGLHFTEPLLEKIKGRGINIVYVTLHVGAGTFLPVKTEDIEGHKMHQEVVTVSRETAGVINSAKKRGNNVICVGTTSLRTLESMSGDDGLVREGTASTDIFIKPGYRFKIVDKMITNFHLPKSTLLILISAFSGVGNVKKLYEFALKKRLRFFSYGDACLLEKA